MASEFEKLLEKSLFRIAVHLQNALKIAAPVDKGILRGSIIVKPSQEGLGLNVFMVHYGKEVEFGTNPHIIEPKNKQALAFKMGGKKIVVKKVMHPGTRPNPFIRTTLITKMSQHMITLTEEGDIKLAGLKNRTEGFNFSKWVQEAFKDDSNLLTLTDIEDKLTKSNIKLSEENLKKIEEKIEDSPVDEEEVKDE